MKFIFNVLFFIFFINSPVLSDEKVYFNSNTGDKLRIVLPKGYCNLSDTDIGKEVFKHLKKTLANQPIVPKIVYNRCNSSEINYPWGYVAIFKQKLPKTITQDELSKYSIDGFRDKELTESILNDINQNHNAFDTKIKVNELGKFNILWNDKDALIFYTTAKSKIGDKEIIEVITGSIFLNKQYAYYSYIVENYSQNNALKVAQELLGSAKATKGQY